MKHPRLNARIAALLYLFVVAAGAFALMAISSLNVRGDAAATAANVVASEPIYRIALTANLTAGAAYVAVVAIFYELFRPAGGTLSIVAAFLGLAGCAISAAATFHGFTPLYLLNGDDYLNAFSTEQLQGQARLAMRQSALGNSVGLVFFGFYCLALGGLVLRARFMPRAIGLLPLLAGAGWLVSNLSVVLAPEFARAFSMPLTAASGLCELLFTLWLLSMGVNEAKWREQASG